MAGTQQQGVAAGRGWQGWAGGVTAQAPSYVRLMDKSLGEGVPGR